MGLRVEQVAKSKRRQEIKRLYTAAFAKEDRMPFWMMVMMSHLWHTDFLAFYDGQALCGFVYLAKRKGFVFILFFAVEEGLRSQGYGSRILSELQKAHPQSKLIVSIEPCEQGAADFQQRVRRKRFYGNNGYVETGYYLKLGKEQEILIKNGTFDKQEFQRFFMFYSNFTMYPKIWQKEA